MRRTFALFLTVLSCLPVAVRAAPPAADGGDGSIGAIGTSPPVVVTASREPETQFEALAPTIVIDRDAIERSLAPDVGELLRYNAGIDVAQAGGPGQQTSIFLRGTNSNHTIVLIDGVRINPGTIGVPAIQNIAPEFIDHIEIVKGPRSTLYGTDAIGGVINVITRTPEGSGLDAIAGYGHYDTREATAEGYYGGTRGSASAAVHWLESAGFPTQVGDTTDRGFRDVSVMLAARTEIEGVEIGARLYGARGNAQYSDLYATPIDADENFRNSVLAADVGGQVSDRLHTRLLLSQAIDDLRQVQTPDYETTRRNALDWQNSADLGVQKLTFGVLLYRENTRSSVFGTNFDVDTHSETGYVEDRATLGRHRLLAAVGYTRHNLFGGHATWNAEYGFAPTAATLFTASFGTAFRAPDSTDQFGFAGNPALKPEAARNVEVGFRRQLTPRQQLTVSLFENRIDDLIQYVSMPTDENPYAGLNENVARSRIRGIEAGWEYRDERWAALVQGIRQDPVNRQDGSTLLRRAKASATLSLARRLGIHELGSDVLVSGPRQDVDNFYALPARDGGYTVANLYWRATLAPGLAVQLRLENAFDKRYEVVSGYYTPRRGLFGAVRYAFH